jgi:hypothetical protein
MRVNEVALEDCLFAKEAWWCAPAVSRPASPLQE